MNILKLGPDEMNGMYIGALSTPLCRSKSDEIEMRIMGLVAERSLPPLSSDGSLWLPC